MKKNYTLFLALVLLINLHAFSQNLMPDPNFSANPTSYEFVAGTVGSGNLDLSVDHTGDGSYSYKLIATTGSNNQMRYILENASGFPITAGQLTFSFWVKGTAGNRVNCNLFNSGAGIWPDGETGVYAEHYVIQATDTWEQVTKTITAAVSGYAQVRVYNKTQGATIHIDDINLSPVVVPTVERIDYTFDDTSDAEGFVGGNGVSLSQPTAGEIQLDIAETNPFPKFEQNSAYSVDASTYKAVVVELINDSPKNQLTFVSPDGGNLFSSSVMTPNDNTNPQTITLDLSGLTNWTGTQTSWWFQLVDNPGGGAQASKGIIIIKRITFIPKKLSIEDRTAFKFKLYPNPVNDELNIKSAESLNSVMVYDMLGRSVLSIKNPSNSVNLSSLNKGFYILKLEAANGGLATKQILKN